jgi:hypothetical protein
MSQLSKHSPLKNPTTHTGLILVTIMAFLCAIVLAEYKSIAARASVANWLVAKKRITVFCDPGNSESKNNIPYKNNGNGCSHMGTSCALFNIGNKRNKIHSC